MFLGRKDNKAGFKKKVSNSTLGRLHFDSMKGVDRTCLPVSSLVTGKFRSPSVPLPGLPQLKKQTHPKLAKRSADVHSWSLDSMWSSQIVGYPQISCLRGFFFWLRKKMPLQPSVRSAERLRCVGVIRGCRRLRPADTRVGHKVAPFDQKISIHPKPRIPDQRSII